MPDFKRFQLATDNWNSQKAQFIASKTHFSTTKKKKGRPKSAAPRQKATFSIPTAYKDEIELIIAEFRQRADAEFTQSENQEQAPDITALAIEFEKLNPPPHIKDF